MLDLDKCATTCAFISLAGIPIGLRFKAMVLDLEPGTASLHVRDCHHPHSRFHTHKQFIHVWVLACYIKFMNDTCILHLLIYSINKSVKVIHVNDTHTHTCPVPSTNLQVNVGGNNILQSTMFSSYENFISQVKLAEQLTSADFGASTGLIHQPSWEWSRLILNNLILPKE